MALTANFLIRRDPMANNNCRNKERLSLIRKIAVAGIAVNTLHKWAVPPALSKTVSGHDLLLFWNGLSNRS